MNITSLRKKIFKKRMNKRGFSSIIGAVFMILIAWSLASAYLFFTLSQNTTYNAAVSQKNQFELERMSEAVQVYNAALHGNNGVVNIDAVIKNAGPSAVTLTTLWVKATDAGFMNYNCTPVNPPLVVQSGESLSKTFSIIVSGVTPEDSLASWFITSRGNTIPIQISTTQNITIAQTTQGIGALTMDFNNFTVYNAYQSPTNSSWYLNFASGQSAYTILSSDQYLVFCINFTNLDAQQRNLVLNLDSELFMVFPSSGGNYQSATWFIVQVNPNTGLLQTPFTNQTLYYNTPTFVYFAANRPVDSTYSFSKQNFVSPVTGTGAVNLALTGTMSGPMGSSPFGQNIPFVSINVNP